MVVIIRLQENGRPAGNVLLAQNDQEKFTGTSRIWLGSLRMEINLDPLSVDSKQSYDSSVKRHIFKYWG